MQTKLQSRPDLLLLLSLLLAILLTPVLDRDGWRRLVLEGVTFIPVVVSTRSWRAPLPWREWEATAHAVQTMDRERTHENIVPGEFKLRLI